MNVKGKVIVVTGGASGIGLSCCEKLLLRDAKFVAIFDIPSPSAERAAKKLKDQFGDKRIDFYACDVTSNEQVESSFGKVIGLFGGFDVLINCAGLSCQSKWEHMINVNLTGLVRTTLKAIDLIGKHKGGKGGTIVNIASTLGIEPWQFLPIYSGTKSGVIGVTHGLKFYYATTGIRMLLVCPGFTETAFATNLFKSDYFDFVDVEQIKQALIEDPGQSVQSVSDTILRMIEKGENGDTAFIWKREPPQLVDLPSLSEIRRRPFYD